MLLPPTTDERVTDLQTRTAALCLPLFTYFDLTEACCKLAGSVVAARTTCFPLVSTSMERQKLSLASSRSAPCSVLQLSRDSHASHTLSCQATSSPTSVGSFGLWGVLSSGYRERENAAENPYSPLMQVMDGFDARSSALGREARAITLSLPWRSSGEPYGHRLGLVLRIFSWPRKLP
ncbi:hypothetical protein BCR34DRAFT_202046 [Clohesyomyces aquaticus]|uniref:Uncharacterized protein n=1 Tax=Clohesyomyces aquaticus TaxID=1231657 RepID=A0A1Y1ZXC7_9PLEO|nr:hypothetical protein BCR34DRAFT_202046 [Clohesyomyces aquaticus]